jgi:hypothetical protein
MARMDEECGSLVGSLEVAEFYHSIFSLMDFALMLCWELSSFGYLMKVECQLRAVLFFPSQGIFPLGFLLSWEGFLRRRSQLVYYTPSGLLAALFGVACALKWFFPIGVLVIVFR